MLARAKLLLEDKDWASANAYCDRVLDIEPQNGTAYLYKLMAELRTSQLDELKNNSYDLILMDVQLPGMNGIDALKKFREIAPHTLVIIVTSVAQYAINGYSVRAFDFILKPVTYYDLVLKLNRAIPLIENKADNKIVVANKTQTNVIKVSDIYYVEIYGHTVVYHTANGIITSTGTMKKVQELLKEHSFALCNQCYFVNLGYVTSVQGYTVTVAGNELAISRQRRSEFMGALNEFFANN